MESSFFEYLFMIPFIISIFFFKSKRTYLDSFLLVFIIILIIHIDPFDSTTLDELLFFLVFFLSFYYSERNLSVAVSYASLSFITVEASGELVQLLYVPNLDANGNMLNKDIVIGVIFSIIVTIILTSIERTAIQMMAKRYKHFYSILSILSLGGYFWILRDIYLNCSMIVGMS